MTTLTANESKSFLFSPTEKKPFDFSFVEENKVSVEETKAKPEKVKAIPVSKV